MKVVYKILLVVIVFVALFLGFYERTIEEGREPVNHVFDIQDEFASYKIQTIRIKNKAYEVYLADTDALRALGLSGKPRPPEGRGMMFTFPRADIYPFWMPEMRFALDIFWIREGRVVEIWENAPFPNGSEIPSHTPSETSDVVLEFSAGFAKEHEIVIGDRVQ